MATARELKNKITSVNNTKKITRTMEMIATAKSVVCQKRIEKIQPYGDKLGELLQDLEGVSSGEGIAEKFPLLRVPSKPKRELVWIVTANRGLCGGYNANVLKLAERHIDAQAKAGIECEVHMIGKKGAGRFRYAERDVAQTYFEFDDKPSFEAVETIFDPQLERFAKGEIDGVRIFWTTYVNAARQVPESRKILPLVVDEADSSGQGSSGQDASAAGADFLFEPSPESILETLVPMTIKMALFQALVEASASEQIARRVAMKNATDNADEMSRKYTQLYNRTRQAGITQEILEIVGGSEAMQG